MGTADRMRLANAEDLYRSVCDNRLDAFLFGSADGQIYAANVAACELFRRTEREICAAGSS